MRLPSHLFAALLLGASSVAQNYTHWWEYENRAAATSSQQMGVARTLAEAGDVDAEMLLAAAYHRGIILSKDDGQYFFWMQRAAEHGSAEAQFTLSNAYRRGSPLFKADPSQVVPLERKAAEQGHFVAQLNLGNDLMEGKYAERNTSEGVMWITRSAEAGFSHAQLLLGMIYIDGQIVPADPVNGERWLRKAAERGHPAALSELARLYASLEGAPRDPAFTETILVRGAEQGNAVAQYQLARMYRKGYLGKRELAKALEWYELSARKHYAPAAFDLGLMYESSDGDTVDLASAVEWYRQAAELGYSPAIAKLGEAYYRGKGIGQDNRLAYRWFSIGALLGAADSSAALKKLEKELRADDAAVIHSDAQEWLAKHPKAAQQKPDRFSFYQMSAISDDPPPPSRGPSTDEERAKAVKIARSLEREPIGEQADANRAWLFRWAAEIPDIYFPSCRLLSEGKSPPKYEFRNALEAQLFAGSDAYLAQHPEKANDTLDIYYAGILSSLAAYESILQAHSEAHWALMDGFLQKRAAAELFDVVHSRTNLMCR